MITNLSSEICEAFGLLPDVLQKIGQSAFGQVYLVKGTNGIQYALKVQENSKFKDSKWELSQKIKGKSPYLIQYFQKKVVDADIFIKMEYANYLTLSKILGTTHTHTGMKLGTIDLLWQLLSGVNVLHCNGIIHRDLKGDNVILHRSVVQGKERITLKIIDFDIARFLSKNQLAQTQCGTPLTMAPEIMNIQNKPVGYDFKADIWSVGILFYQLVTNGKHPFESATTMSSLVSMIQQPILRPQSLKPNKSTNPSPPDSIDSCSAADACWDLIHQMLSFDPAKRPTAEEGLKSVLFKKWGPGSKPTTAALQTPTPTPQTLTPAPRTQNITPQTPTPAKREFGSYVFKQQIGGSAHGKVYKVQHKVTNVIRALKVISIDNKSVGGLKSMEGELIIGMKFGSSCVFLVNYEQVTVLGEECYVVMEYCSGGDLRQLIDTRVQKKEPFTEEEILRLLLEIGLALRTLHVAGVVHRDIKPENIYRANNGSFKLGDYGMARYVSMNSSMSMAGTGGYIAPEVLQGESDYNAGVDIYSLGCILLEMMELRHPFRNEKGNLNIINISLGKHNQLQKKEYSSALVALVLQMISVDVSKRPTVDQLLAFPSLFSFLMSDYTAAKKKDLVEEVGK